MFHPPQRLRLRALVLSVAALGGISAVAAGAATAAPARDVIPGSHPHWANGAHSAGGAVNSNVDVRVYLQSRDAAGLTAYAKAVSDPSNAQYGKYLSATQAEAQFGPTGAESQAVAQWLKTAGMTVTGSTSGFGAYVEATGTTAQATAAFGTGFANYTDAQGNTARAPQSAATVPASVASDVAAVSGLDTAQHLMQPAAAPPHQPGSANKLPPPPSNFWVAPPTSDFYGQNVATNEPPAGGSSQPWNVTGYTPQQIRGAYGVTASGATGAGQTVAVVDAYASPTMLQDANQFATTTHNQPFAAGQYQQILAKRFDLTKPTQCGAAGWYGEETLDVESVHGMAPDANVRYVGAQDCTDAGLLAAEAFIVDNKTASIVTNSWGEPADSSTLNAVYDQIFQVGATEGIGFFFSSGDSGYEDPAYEDGGSDQIQVDYPTSSPWVTSVGGTSLAIGQNNNYMWEAPWGTVQVPLAADGMSWAATPPGDPQANYDGSGGGGVSTQYPQPSYQAGVVPNSLATAVPEGSTSTPMRVVPDVSALADPSTGMLVGQTTLQPNGKTFAFALSRIGGTSVACPTFAGIEADAQQMAGGPLGFANPAIYSRAGSSAFNDVTEPATQQYEVRNNYPNSAVPVGPVLTFLRAIGINGTGASALLGTPGYDDATGVGSPANYVQSFGG